MYAIVLVSKRHMLLAIVNRDIEHGHNRNSSGNLLSIGNSVSSSVGLVVKLSGIHNRNP